jgi:predicted MPP superfamily phosphohydrolase
MAGIASSLFIALLGRNAELPQWLLGGMYNIGSIWLVFTLYMVLALLAVDLLRIFVWHQPLKEYGFAAAFLFTAVLLIYGYGNYRNPKIEEVTIDLSKDGSSGKREVKIVAASDVHLGFATRKKHLQRYVEKINSLTPDIILIGGDLIDNSIKPVEQQRMQEELGMLKAPGGIFMVPGNHEYISDMADVEAFLQKTPIVLLRDSVVMHPCGVAIAGRDDRSNRHRLTVKELLKGIKIVTSSTPTEDSEDVNFAENFAGPVILLDHQPYEVAHKDSLGVDVQFSGHTHHGQVWPMSLLVDSMYDQSHGYRKWNNSHVIVSSGLSLWGPPFRIGTNSDLWVINLKY